MENESCILRVARHHSPVVLGDRRKWNESTKGKAWSGSKLGRAGDGARELLPWTACPARRRTLTPSILLRGTPGAVWPCALFISLFNTGCVVSCSRIMCLAPTADPPRSLLPACSPCIVLNVEEEKGSFSTRCTEPARCPVVCELSVVAPHPSKNPRLSTANL